MQSMGQKALSVATQNGWISADALIVWEENTPQVAPEGFTQRDQRKYGDTWMTFLEVAGAKD